MKDYSKFLVQEDLIYFQPTLAKKLGLNEAILLQKIQGWLQCKPHDAEGRSWIYNTYKSWQEQLPFWSEDTIRRTLNKLVEMEIIIRNNFNQKKFDRTYWYSIDYEKLDEICGCNMQLSKCANCTNGIEQIANTYTNDNNNDNKENNISKDIYKRKNKNKPSYDEIINSKIESNEIKELIYEFIKMRTLKKRPLTDRALLIQVNKLLKLSSDTEAQKRIIEKSIVKCWDEFYELKEEEVNKPKKVEDIYTII